MMERGEVWLFSVQKTFIVSVTNGLRGSVKFLQFMLQGFNSISHHRLCDSRSHALAFFSFFFSQTAVRVCVSVHILLSFSQRRSIENTFHHLRGWVAEWGLSWCWLWTLSVCTWVAHWAGTTITSTYSCSSRLAEQISLSLSAPRRTLPAVVCACFLFKPHSNLDTRVRPSAGNVAMPHYAESSHRFLSKHFNCSMCERLERGKKKGS